MVYVNGRCDREIHYKRLDKSIEHLHRFGRWRGELKVRGAQLYIPKNIHQTWSQRVSK